MLQRRHKRLGEHSFELCSIDGARVLLGFIKRVQLRIQVPVHLLHILGSPSSERRLVAVDHLHFHACCMMLKLKRAGSLPLRVAWPSCFGTGLPTKRCTLCCRRFKTLTSTQASAVAQQQVCRCLQPPEGTCAAAAGPALGCCGGTYKSLWYPQVCALSDDRGVFAKLPFTSCRVPLEHPSWTAHLRFTLLPESCITAIDPLLMNGSYSWQSVPPEGCGRFVNVMFAKRFR
jgi:hypothetical protein